MYCSTQQPNERHYQLLPLPHQHLSLSWTNTHVMYRPTVLFSLIHHPTMCHPQYNTVCRKKRSRTWMTMMNTNIVTNMTFPTQIVRSFYQSQSYMSQISSFLPDFTEHPKPKIHHSPKKPPPLPPVSDDDDDDGSSSSSSSDDDDANSNGNSDEISFIHDFIAGGVAGSASVIVGHPFDTIKVRLQTSNATIVSSIYEFGGITSLFRGMTAPLGAAAVINAIVFGSYGFSSRLYDKYSEYMPSSSSSSLQVSVEEDVSIPTHDPWQKSLLCGAFAGFVQAFVICPLEHIKCRLQIQVKPSTKSTMTALSTKKVNHNMIHPLPEYYNGPMDAAYKITTKYGIHRLYQGWVSTLLRE